MAEGPLRIPDISYRELRAIAAEFLEVNHPGGGIPIPVEEIIELNLKLDIIPTPGLRRFFHIDGYVSKDFRDISVDQYLQESNSPAYRYTLAHELAHVLIHRDVAEQMKFETIEEWKRLILTERNDEHSVE